MYAPRRYMPPLSDLQIHLMREEYKDISDPPPGIYDNVPIEEIIKSVLSYTKRPAK